MYQLYARGPEYIFNTNGRDVALAITDIKGFEYYNDGLTSAIDYKSKTSPVVNISRNDEWKL